MQREGCDSNLEGPLHDACHLRKDVAIMVQSVLTPSQKRDLASHLSHNKGRVLQQIQLCCGVQPLVKLLDNTIQGCADALGLDKENRPRAHVALAVDNSKVIQRLVCSDMKNDDNENEGRGASQRQTIMVSNVMSLGGAEAVDVNNHKTMLPSPSSCALTDIGIPCVDHSEVNNKRAETTVRASKGHGVSGVGVSGMVLNHKKRKGKFTLSECVSQPGNLVPMRARRHALQPAFPSYALDLAAPREQSIRKLGATNEMSAPTQITNQYYCVR